MMFLTNTTPTKQARKTCWVKRGYQQIKLQYMVVGMMLHFRTTCNAIPCNAIIDMGRCCFKSFECGSHSTLTAITIMYA